MDFEGVCSNSRSDDGEEEKGEEEIGQVSPFGEIKAESNGEIGFDEQLKIDVPIEKKDENGIGGGRGAESSTEAIGSPPMAEKATGNGIGVKNTAESPPKSIGSPSNSAPELSSQTTKKGYGLKKWRRIRRDLNKDGTGSVDSAQILKRRLSLNEQPKAREENKLKSDGEGEIGGPVPSAGSPHSLEVNVTALDPDLELLVADRGFSIGVDSDNSEDRSSKSSTNTSIPKPRHETGFGRERGRTKILGGRGSGNAGQQRNQRGKGGFDASKKIRGDRVRLEKENSQSSVESDLRSSNVGFMRWGSVVINGKQSEKSLNYDGEHSDEAQTCEEVRSGYYKENGGDENSLGVELHADLLEKDDIEKSENCQANSDIDPFVESIVLLQAAQDALEKEIQKFGEVGKPTLDGLDCQLEGTGVSSSPSFEAHLLELNHKVESLKCKLEQASATLEAKESKVLELEAILNRTLSPDKDGKDTDLLFLQEMRKEMEFEVEGLIKNKIEAEVEYLIITKTTQRWKVLDEDQVALFKEQMCLAGDQAQMMLKLRDAEDKAIKLKEQVEELEAYCKELLGTEKVIKMQNKVCKFSLCCFIQLVILCIAFGLFLIQLLPPDNAVVPT